MNDGNPIPSIKDSRTELTRKASVLVHVLTEILAGRDDTLHGHNVEGIARAHGWPNRAAVQANIDALRPLGDLPVTFDIPPTTAKEPAMPDPIEDLLRQAETHDQPKIVKKAGRIRTLIDDLETAIEADREDAERRARIAALKAELAALKPPRKPRKPGNNAPKGVYPCDGCDRILDTPQGLSAHRRRAHEGWNPQAGRAAS